MMSNSEEVTPACKDVKEETSWEATCETDEMHMHLKRQLSSEAKVPFVKKKRRKQEVAISKNALMQLCDIKRWVQFKFVSQTESIFTMSVEVNGQTFTGKGPSKKKARLNAAEQAVKSLLHLPNTEDADQPKGRQIPNMDFTAESGVDVLFNKLQKGPDEEKLNVRDAKITNSVNTDCEMHGCSNPQISDVANVPFSMIRQTTNESTVPENALKQLYDMKRYVRFQFVSQTEPIFTMSVEINGKTFVGKGPSKKKAKLDAAEHVFKSFVQLPNAVEANQAIDQQITNVGFTSDLAKSGDDVSSNDLQRSHDEEKLDGNGASTISPNESNLFSGRMSKVTKQPGQTIPVMRLNELRTDLKNEILSEIKESPIKFSLFGSNGSNEGVQSELHEDASNVPKVLVDLVSRLVDEKITSLIGGFKSQNAVLAGIVARGYKVDSTKHICVSADVKVDRPNGAEEKKD